MDWKWIWKWTLVGLITLIIASNLIGSYIYMKSQGGYYEVNNVETSDETP